MNKGLLEACVTDGFKNGVPYEQRTEGFFDALAPTLGISHAANARIIGQFFGNFGGAGEGF